MTAAPTIQLSQYRQRLAEVTIDGAGSFEVYPITGVALELIDAARSPGNGRQIWEAAKLCLPTAPAEAVMRLTSAEVEVILSIATTGEVPASAAPSAPTSE